MNQSYIVDYLMENQDNIRDAFESGDIEKLDHLIDDYKTLLNDLAKNTVTPFEKIVEGMKELGWSLDDFKETAKYHIRTAEKELEKMECERVENDITYLLQFATDFMKVSIETEGENHG